MECQVHLVTTTGARAGPTRTGQSRQFDGAGYHTWVRAGTARAPPRYGCFGGAVAVSRCNLEFASAGLVLKVPTLPQYMRYFFRAFRNASSPPFHDATISAAETPA
jgi:hypothetical protein